MTMCRPGARWLWLLLAMWMLATTAVAGDVSVRAFVDRDHVQLGDTVTLNIEVDGTTHVPAPDVSALASDFEILGTSHHTSISIVNGQGSVQSLWAIALKPRHVGTLTIPSLTVNGQATAPLTLTVEAASASPDGGPGDAVFLRVEPSTRTPYVGQQIDLAVRLFYAPNVNSGSIDLPHGRGVFVRPLGKGTRYQVRRGGRVYHVLENHYALTAGQAGTLDLPPVTFKGSMAEPGSFAQFLGRGHPVSARSDRLRLDVRQRPPGSNHTAWLPARKLTLELTGLPPDGQVTVGQPLTLTLTEKAVGLAFESLPKPQLPDLHGVDVYPDQSRDHTGDDGHWLLGTRARKFALVPQQPGTLTIPPITLAWWNVQTGKQAVARIPAHTLKVAPAVAAAGQAPPVRPAPAASAAMVTPNSPSRDAAKPSSVTGSRAASAPDHVLAWLALGLWIVTMLVAAAVWGWRRHRRATPAAPAPPRATPTATRRMRQAFLEAARGGSVAAQCDRLIDWARAERPALRHLGELAEALDSPAQGAAIAGLQRARYGDAADGPDAAALEAAFGGGLAWRKDARRDAPDGALPPLYP